MESRGWPSTHIAGSLEQGERIKAITKLKSYDCRILVSTDLVRSLYDVMTTQMAFFSSQCQLAAKTSVLQLNFLLTCVLQPLV